MSYDYGTYITNVANMLVVPVNDPNYQAIVPRMIDDAEQRIYRELDLLNTIIRTTAGNFVPGTRNFTFPQFITVSESINFFTPAGTLNYRQQLIPVSREWMDAVYPDDRLGCFDSGFLPRYYAMITDQLILVGPAPDQPYTAEVIGTIRPTPLSTTNTTTYLTTYLPDLFFAESLIFGFGYLQDFGVAADNPQASVTWSSHYQDLWQSAMAEEGRKKYGSQAWTSKSVTPQATPPRT